MTPDYPRIIDLRCAPHATEAVLIATYSDGRETRQLFHNDEMVAYAVYILGRPEWAYATGHC